MDIAVVTGASSGLGEEYVKHIASLYPELDEIWIIARRKERLEQLAEKITDVKCRAVACDVTSDVDVKNYENELKQSGASVKMLINNAGFGKLGYFDEIDAATNAAMVRLNCEAVTVMTNITIPYMDEKSFILNVCSIASFVPNARMTVYSATKAFIKSFSRALREELKRKKINVSAVCPGPMDTEFLAIADIPEGASKTFDTLPHINPSKVALGSLKAAAKGRGVYTPHPFYKFYRVLAKLIPHSIMMKLAKT